MNGTDDAPRTPEPTRAKCLCIDIETAGQDKTILREIGAFRPDTDARTKLSGKAKDLVQRLDAITEGAAFVLGHNVVAFDKPALRMLHLGLALHRLPLVDTLEQSPVAFPHYPYHRLLKDYTRFRSSPTTLEGKSLQQAFVENGFAGKPSLAIMPTGGGKSLCFQLLALARYYRNGSLAVGRYGDERDRDT